MSTERSLWASIITFDDREGIGDDPPIVYRGEDVFPNSGDRRAGQLDIAEIPADVLSSADNAFLRFGTTAVGSTGEHATVVLDGRQVRQLVGTAFQWLERHHMFDETETP